jgi:hypothetical protein
MRVGTHCTADVTHSADRAMTTHCTSTRGPSCHPADTTTPETQRPSVSRLGTVATQLREYRITEGSLHRFIDEWREQIAPLRREMGFTIEHAWTVEGESRFIWLLAHPGDWNEFEAADRAYYASPQRANLEPNPARLIEEQTLTRLTELDL